MIIATQAYVEKIRSLHLQLGIPVDFGNRSRLPLQPECEELQDAGRDLFGRPQSMEARTLLAWNIMRAAAAKDDVGLLLVSAFRSLDYQSDLIRRKLNQGTLIKDILQVIAAPGYSEHHTGRALDLTTQGCPCLEEAFDETAAFRWLTEQAGHYGFVMSFPRDNPYEIGYEPWHWTYWSDLQSQCLPGTG